MSIVRIAMWSGPRNISTAMMRAFENRQDCAVWDEPLYGPYLHLTGIPHPGADDIIADQGREWQPVADACVHHAPSGANVFYQKHMTHHLLPTMDWDWLRKLRNCFLIRDPEEVLASYRRTRPDVTEEDLGIVRQAEIYDYVCGFQSSAPPIVDAKDFLQAPEAYLRALCAHFDIEFTDRMLSWPAGRRDSDGVWGPYWYDAVWASTGFEAYRPRDVTTPPEYEALVARSIAHYDRLRARRLRP
ncbi:MAG: HAD family hydrolase [Pseudomonadota bacterium]